MHLANRTDFDVDERRETGLVGGGELNGVSTAELGGEDDGQHKIDRTGNGVGWGDAMTDSTDGRWSWWFFR